MLTVTPPATFDGATLREELAAAGVTVTAEQVLYDPSGPALHLDLPASDKATVERVLAAHVPSSDPPSDPDAELVAAITAATSLAQLKDALIGKGRSAVVAGRDKNR